MRKGSWRGLWASVSAVVAGRAAALAILLALTVVRIADPVPVEELRLRIFDLFQRIAPRPEGNAPVVIVDIDDQSLTALGQWPWPRSLIADLVNKLAEAGAVAVAFDIVFAEPDRTSPAEVARQLRDLDEATRVKLRSLESNDQLLAKSFANIRTIVAQSGFGRKISASKAAELPDTPLGILGPDPTPFLVSFPDLLTNVPELEEAAAGRGLFTIRPDEDGIVRRVPVVMKAAGRFKPALAVELLRVATGSGAVLLKTDAAGVKSFAIGGVSVPTDSNARLWVRYNKHDTRRFISAKDVLQGDGQSRQKLKGKLVFVGTSAIGLLDIKTTPVEPAMPGVEVHAQLVENILAGSPLLRPNYAIGAEVVTALLVGAVIISLVPILGAVYVLYIGAGLAAVFAGGAFYLFQRHGMLFDVTYPLISSFAVFWTLVFVNYFREETRRQQIRSAFGQYLSPAFVEELANNPDKLKLGGETKELTILFSDVRNFTTISETYKRNPQGLTRLMNRLLSPLSEAVVANGGTIDKYIGDCIMAFWNAPLDDPEHARHACKTALDMLAALERVNAERREEAEKAGEPQVTLAIGLGINTGEVVVGNMGSDVRFDYTVLGDSVNLASRLEGQTKSYGVSVILGSRTNELVAHEFATLPLDLIQVKGKSEPENIFGLLGERTVLETPDFIELKAAHERMLQAFAGRKWAEALALLRQSRERMLRYGLAVVHDMFEQRIAEYRRTPPPAAWNGVYVARTK